MTNRLVSYIRCKGISYAICDRQSGIGAGLSASTAIGTCQYDVTVILYHLHCTVIAIGIMTVNKINFFLLSFYISLTKAILTSPLISASTLQHIFTLIEGRCEIIIFWNCTTHFNKYLWIYTRVHLEMKDCVFGVVNVNGKVNLLVDTCDISFFII